MSEIGKIIRVNALPPTNELDKNAIYQVAVVGSSTYIDYAVDENGDVKTASMEVFDNILRFNTRSVFPPIGVIGKLYIDLEKADVYTWNGITNSYKLAGTDPSWKNSVSNSINTLAATIETINKYSTEEEIKVGTWIDEKPIYRKVFQIENKDNHVGDSLELENLIPDLEYSLPNVLIEKLENGIKGNFNLHDDYRIVHSGNALEAFRTDGSGRGFPPFDFRIIVEFTKAGE